MRECATTGRIGVGAEVEGHVVRVAVPVLGCGAGSALRGGWRLCLTVLAVARELEVDLRAIDGGGAQVLAEVAPEWAR